MAQYKTVNDFSSNGPQHDHHHLNGNYGGGGGGYDDGPSTGYVGRDSYHEPVGVAYDERTFATSGLKREDVEVGQPLYDGCNHAASQRFIRTGYRDVWALVLFALAVVLSCGIAIHNGRDLHEGKLNLSHSARHELALVRDWTPIGFCIALFLAAGLMAAMRAFTEQFIIVANVLVIIVNAVFGAWALAKGFVMMGVIWLLMAAFNGLWLYLVRRRIPFAAVLLRTSVTLITRHYGTIVVSIICLLAGAAYLAVWLFMAAPVFATISDASDTGNSVPAWVAAAVFGLLIAMLWVSQVCANVSHVTSGGVVATWYFFGEAAMPLGATAASAKRATTTSFGSICFGSLVVAVIKAIYYMVRMSVQQSRNSFAVCILLCIMNIIERLVEYFNVYAFTHVAIYGSSYVEAAKQTWRLVKECGWSAYFNDCLVWPVLTMVTLFPALALGVGLGLATSSVPVGVAVFLVVYVTLMLCMRPVYSGVVTQFVCVAECPDVMQQTNPQYHRDVDDATQRMVRRPPSSPSSTTTPV